MSRPQHAYDWNIASPQRKLVRPGVTFLDETLRDGIQNPSVVDPSLEDKLELVRVMDALGIHLVNAGLPASSARNRSDTELICREIAHSKLSIRPVAAGRTVVSDIEPILDISQKVGIAVEIYTFIGSSPIRKFVESWDTGDLVKHSTRAIELAAREGASVCFVTEDTTRSRPETLRTLWRAAIDHGAKRLCLADTVGHVTPDGVNNLIGFTRSVISETGADVGIDWHGHNDRGLALDNALSALQYGADRIHGTALGIGERTGNAPLERILQNLWLMGELDGRDPELLVRYVELSARAVGWDDSQLVLEDLRRSLSDNARVFPVKSQVLRGAQPGSERQQV